MLMLRHVDVVLAINVIIWSCSISDTVMYSLFPSVWCLSLLNAGSTGDGFILYDTRVQESYGTWRMCFSSHVRLLYWCTYHVWKNILYCEDVYQYKN